MSIEAVSAATSSVYNSSEVQLQKLNLEKNEQSPKTENSTEKAAEEVTNTGTKILSSVEGGATVEISSHGDTVEISKQGMSKNQSMPKPTNTASTEQTETSTISSTSETAIETITSEDLEDSSDLSQYSEYQLKAMLAEGTISSAEYNAEIESRKVDEGSSVNDDSIDSGNELLKSSLG